MGASGLVPSYISFLYLSSILEMAFSQLLHRAFFFIVAKINLSMKTLSRSSFKLGICLLITCFSSQWAAAQSFGGESVEHDSVANRFFSSSDGTSIVQRFGNGTISHFGTGLDADYGMEVMGNTLFAITGDDVRGYDLTTEMQVMSITINGAGFLNGLASNGTDKLWATDFGNDKIYEIDVTSLSFPSYTEIVSNTVSTPNGIVYDGANNRLVFVNWGSNAPIKAVDLSNNMVSTLVTTSLGNIDGIDIDNQGNFYISSWTPDRISKYDNAFANPPVTISAPGVNNPADICYALSTDTLGIPNGNGTVTFVGFTPSVNTEAPLGHFALSIGPNPVSESSAISFEMQAPSIVRLSVFNLKGQLQQVLLQEDYPAGSHKVLLQGSGLTAGKYFLVFETEDQRITRKFVKVD